MDDRKIIAVVGATGAQGGGLVRAILADPKSEYEVRAITRDVNSDKAKALASQGVSVVAADSGNRESMVRAFTGAYGAFCVTMFWEHFSAELEYEQAGNMAQAAKEAGVQHVIWSTLEDTRKLLPIEDDRMPILKERYNVPHFDGKGAANQLFVDAGVPVTLFNTCFYWDNFIYFGSGPQRGEDGKLYLTLPMGSSKLPAIAAEDIGKCALGVFKAGGDYIGKEIGIAGEHLTGEQMAAALSETVGEQVLYNDVPPEVYRSFPFDGADDLGNMYHYKRDFETEYCAARPLDLSRRLNPELMTLKDWLGKYGKQIPIQ